MAWPFGLSRLTNIFAQRQAEDARYPDQQRISTPRRTLASVPITPDNAITIPAAWACLRYLSQTPAVLPWHVMRPSGEGGEKFSTHPVDYLLGKRPNPEWSSMQFRETLIHWAVRWGNGYAEIEPDSRGRPVNLWPIHPERCETLRDPDSGELYYEVDGKIKFDRNEIYHLRGFGEGPVGVNVVAYAAESLGWAKAAQLFGASFFGNGMNVNGIVKLKRPMSIPGQEELKKQLRSEYGRDVRKANQTPVVLDNDMDWVQTQIDPEKGQFNETNRELMIHVCQWFGVPPHKIMDLSRATFSNIEAQDIKVVVDSVSPWVKRLEDEADAKLFGQNREGLYTKINLNALMRGDVAARGTWYKTMNSMGVFTINKILELEDMPTIGPLGDKRVVMGSQFVTLEQLGEQPVAPSPPSPPSREPPSQRRRALMRRLREMRAVEFENVR